MADEQKPPDDAPKRRRYNTLCNAEDCRRNMARIFRKADRGLVPWKDAAHAATVIRALIETIEKSTGDATLQEVQALLVRVREQVDLIRKKETEAN